MKRLLALVTLLLPLVACEREATITLADYQDYAPDGSGRLQIGRVTSVRVYTVSQGCSTQSFPCDGDHDHVESSDPTVLAITGTRYGEERAPGGTTSVIDSTIVALREGEVTLTATCSEDVAVQRVRVVP